MIHIGTRLRLFAQRLGLRTIFRSRATNIGIGGEQNSVALPE